METLSYNYNGFTIIQEIKNGDRDLEYFKDKINDSLYSQIELVLSASNQLAENIMKINNPWPT